MGQILSVPITEKESLKDSDKYLAYGFSCMQGWRVSMEDAHAMILDLDALSSDSDEKDACQEVADEEKDSRKEDEEEEEVEDKKGAEAATTKDESASKDSEEDSASTSHIAFFGVYDGHGGSNTAKLTGTHLHHLIKSTAAYKKRDYSNALKNGFLNCDKFIWDIAKVGFDDSGCAATSVIITPSQLFCGNAGDSRTIMSINGYAKPLSYDHKPSNEGEKTRIMRAGGYVEMGRVNGNLALSRGIGDFEFKRSKDLPPEEQVVTCYPDVIQHNLDFESDEFVVLACDGIWDCLTSQACVECVRYGIYNRKPLETICEEIMELCCAPTAEGTGIGCDNMSITIVALLDYAKNETLDQWYDKIISRIEAKINDPEATTYGPISLPYDELYKQMFGPNYSIGSAGEEFDEGDVEDVPGAFGASKSFRANDEDDEEGSKSGPIGSGPGGAISLKDFLASRVTNENGVIYLDNSSAQSILAHFGMSNLEEEEEEEEEDDEEADEDSEGSKQGGSDKNQIEELED